MSLNAPWYALRMNRKTVIWTGMAVGSTIGSFVPLLWGADLISFSSVVVSGVGAVLGVWGGYQFAKYTGV